MSERANPEIARFEDYYSVTLPPNERVNRCYIDYQFTIQLLESELLIVIESPFSLRTSTSTTKVEIDPPERLAPALSLVRRGLESIKAYDAGKLEVGLDEMVVEVQPHSLYEAWHLTGPDGAMIVCMPGGRLAVW